MLIRIMIYIYIYQYIIIYIYTVCVIDNSVNDIYIYRDYI